MALDTMKILVIAQQGEKIQNPLWVLEIGRPRERAREGFRVIGFQALANNEPKISIYNPYDLACKSSTPNPKRKRNLADLRKRGGKPQLSFSWWYQSHEALDLGSHKVVFCIESMNKEGEGLIFLDSNALENKFILLGFAHKLMLLALTDIGQQSDFLLGNWDDHLPLVEFAYNNSYQASIRMPLYEMLYGRKFRTPVCWEEVGRRELASTDVVLETTEKIETILSPSKGVLRFRNKGKLSIRFTGPFKILKSVGEVAYVLELPEEMKGIHNTFHVSYLRKFLADEMNVVTLDDIEIDPELTSQEELKAILGRKTRQLRNKEIPFVKVQWRHCKGSSIRWDLEEMMRGKYPHLFQE
ncbi:putative reverse transcriptase domain-containing protein [Tanacetum coccineum]